MLPQPERGEFARDKGLNARYGATQGPARNRAFLFYLIAGQQVQVGRDDWHAGQRARTRACGSEAREIRAGHSESRSQC